MAGAGLDPRRRRLALLAAILGSFVVGLDGSVINVALPTIGDELGGGLAGQQWVSNAYLLTLGSLILVGGSLGDVLGERRVFATGVAGFGLASILCAAAPSIEMLVGARALQGVFGALLTPAALAVIVAAFPPAQRGAAIGTWTAWSGIAMLLGPLAGGWLIDTASWRWIFAINVPFVLATLVLVAVAVPGRTAGGPQRRIDWLGAALCAGGLAGPVYGLISQPEYGWLALQVIVPIVAGLVLFAAFLLHEARTADPMLPLELFRRRNFAIGNLQTLAMYGGLSVTFFFLVLFLQQVSGWTALRAGLATLPATIVMFLLSRRFGALASRIGPRLLMGFGPLVSAAGLLWLAALPVDPNYFADLLAPVLVFSLGLAMTVAPLTATVLADADDENAGIASGVNNAIARVAGLVAIAGLGAVVASAFRSSLGASLQGVTLSPAGQVAADAAERATFARADVQGLAASEAARLTAAVEQASLHAFQTGMLIAAVLVAVGGVIGLIGIANPRREVDAAGCAGGQLAGAPTPAAD